MDDYEVRLRKIMSGEADKEDAAKKANASSVAKTGTTSKPSDKALKQARTERTKVSGTKKSKRRMKKQVRRTVAALFMASAIAVAAIPVESINANSDSGAADTMESIDSVNQIRTVHHTDGTNSSYETIEGVAADSAWESKVPYIKITTAGSTGDTIYVDDTKSFQFAYVPENNTTTERAVVVVGIQNSAIKGGTLTIPDKIDAYRQYNVNTTDGSYCAVTGDGSFLYYPTQTQKTDAQNRVKYSALIYPYEGESANPSIGTETIGSTATIPIYVYVNPDNPTDSTRRFTTMSGGVEVDLGTDYVNNLSLTFDDKGTLTAVNQSYKRYSYIEVNEANEPIPHYIDGNPENKSPDNIEYLKGWVNQDPKSVPSTAEMEEAFSPCYLDSKAKWFKDGQDVQLYYLKAGKTISSKDDLKVKDNFAEVNDQDESDEKQRIHDVRVKYIGMQRITTVNIGGADVWTVTEPTTKFTESGGVWTLTETPNNGVFYGNRDLVNLVIEGDLLGIGDFAFNSLPNLSSITLNEKLNTIGNGAFKGCHALSSLTLPVNTNLAIIGASAFEDCTSLTSFKIPHAVVALGDRAFRGCYSMTSFDMNYDPTGMSLEKIGYNVFEDCSSLSSLEFPRTIKQKVPVHYFKGCTGLQYIKSNNNEFDIVDGDPRYSEPSKCEPGAHDSYHNITGKYCDIDEWLDELSPNFYFEGADASELHKTAKAHSATFLYDDGDYVGDYEVVQTCNENPSHESTWIVNTNNEIVHVDVNEECKEIIIPAAVGQYGISKLSANTFKNNCSLQKIYIPNTVNEIETGAFQGCHNLQDVIFTEPYNYNLQIGDGAFDTQMIVSKAGNAYQCSNCNHEIGKTNADMTHLTFTGDMISGYAPFDYAMDPANNYNNTNPSSSQPRSYITYYSSWPTLLTARYNYEDDTNELIDYPRTGDLINPNWISIFPSLSLEDQLAAQNAPQAVIDGVASQAQADLVDATHDIVIPAGIESIKDGIFSGRDTEGELLATKIKNVNSDGTIDYTSEPNTSLNSVTMSTVKKIDPYTFAGCTGLKKADITGNESIGDYAFRKAGLNEVYISGDTSELGVRPFSKCDDLYDVTFNGSNFKCDNAIIYQLGTDGSKQKIIECLPSRGKTDTSTNSVVGGSTAVSRDELAGVSEIQDEAFMGCNYITSVNLDQSTITNVPEYCFASDGKLGTVDLPETVELIKEGAFLDDPRLTSVSIPSLTTQLADNYVFAETKMGTEKNLDGVGEHFKDYYVIEKNPYKTEGDILNDRGTVTLNTPISPTKSSAAIYAGKIVYLNADDKAREYGVTFYDVNDDGNTYIYDQYTVESGKTLERPPIDPSHDGRHFQGWFDDLEKVMVNDVTSVVITQEYEFTARYDTPDITVKFFAFYTDTEPFAVKTIPYGTSCSTPSKPDGREGYTWVKWAKEGDELEHLTEDVVVYGVWDPITDNDKHLVRFINFDDTVVSMQYVVDGEAAIAPATNPTRAGYTFAGWKPSDLSNITADKDFFAQFNASSGNNNDKPTSGTTSGNESKKDKDSSSGNSSSKKTYTVTVVGGSGSGTYEEGATVIIAANDPASGKVFDKWTTSDATLASTSMTATTFTMPGKNVTVTANYKDGDNKTTAAKTATGNGSRPAATGYTTTGDTSVIVTRPGVSNTNVASATVHGSSDSFIVKVTETNEATNAVENALNNRYGSLDGLEYWACDISLYDATGNTKITDTSGLTVDITLPIPDELRQYGGNNKAGAVANNNLEDLNTKFNTINGTPTVTFTATHFSPYVIYADTNNLDAAQMLDASPKTGDPIHPKWFLALGLAAASIVLFLKKDKNPKVVTA